MSLFDTFKAAFSRSKTSAGAPDRDPADDVANQLRYKYSGFSSPVSTLARQTAEAAMLNPIIYRCVNKIAETVQGIDWYVEKIGADESRQDKRVYIDSIEKSVQALLDYPSEDLSAPQLKYWLALNMALYGNVFLKIGVDRFKGVANGIYPLLTAKTYQTISETTGQITGYNTWSPDGEIRIPTRWEAEQGGKPKTGYAGHMFKPSLDYINRTHSPLESLGYAPEISELLMRRAWETASGNPNIKYVAFVPPTYTADQEDAFSEGVSDRKAGGTDAGNMLIISGDRVGFEKLDNGMSDIHAKVPLDDMARMVASIFGIPVALLGLGAADAAKFTGNYGEARLSFIFDTIVPAYLELIEDGLTKMVCPAGYRVKFDLDSIPAVRLHRVNTAVILSDVNFLTMDEKRAMINFGKAPKDGKYFPDQPQPDPMRPIRPGVKPE